MIAVKNQISNKLVMLLNILENQEQPWLKSVNGKK
jgi:hypothetical protein